MNFKIYTDGACSGNPGIGGYAYLFIRNKNNNLLESGNKKLATNNEMELTAVVCALKKIESKYGDGNYIEIFSDSAYVVNSINQGWILGWRKNDWKTKTNDQIKNIKLWQYIYDRLKCNEIKMHKVKGHSGNEYNEIVDRAARNEIIKLKSLGE